MRKILSACRIRVWKSDDFDAVDLYVCHYVEKSSIARQECGLDMGELRERGGQKFNENLVRKILTERLNLNSD